MNAETSTPKVYRSKRWRKPGGCDVRLPRVSYQGRDILAGCDSDELSYFITEVVKLGHLASFSETSDGGALVVAILTDDVQFKSYPKDGNQCLECFTVLLRACRGEE